MNEMKQVVEAAFAPIMGAIDNLQNEVKSLRAEVQGLTAKLKSMTEPPKAIQESAAILKSIPEEVLKDLNVIGVFPDPKQTWFSLHLANGKSISVKKQEFDFRIRLRDDAGKLVKELTPSSNGLVNALKSLKDEAN